MKLLEFQFFISQGKYGGPSEELERLDIQLTQVLNYILCARCTAPTSIRDQTRQQFYLHLAM